MNESKYFNMEINLKIGKYKDKDVNVNLKIYFMKPRFGSCLKN